MDEIERRVAALERAVMALAGFVPPAQLGEVIEILAAEGACQSSEDAMIVQGSVDLLTLAVAWPTFEAPADLPRGHMAGVGSG